VCVCVRVYVCVCDSRPLFTMSGEKERERERALCVSLFLKAIKSHIYIYTYIYIYIYVFVHARFVYEYGCLSTASWSQRLQNTFPWKNEDPQRWMFPSSPPAIGGFCVLGMTLSYILSSMVRFERFDNVRAKSPWLSRDPVQTTLSNTTGLQSCWLANLRECVGSHVSWSASSSACTLRFSHSS